MVSLEEGDAPTVRDLLFEHFRDPALEVEGKLGRRSKDKFTAGVSAEQFAALEARLCGGLPEFGLAATTVPPAVEVTVDRFHAVEGGASSSQHQARPRGRPIKCSTVRSSFACDASGRPLSEPFEVLNKTRLSDCHIGRPVGHSAPPDFCLVDVRVSFSFERAVPGSSVEGRPLVYERRKERQTFRAKLFCIQLTHVLVDGRETFEVEVELRMDVAKARIEGSEAPADEALVITRELVGILRDLSRWSAEIPLGRKRKRLEDFQAVELALRATLEEPEVDAELRRCVGEGKDALNQAKKYLCSILQVRLPPVDQVALCRIAGRQVARILQRQRSEEQKCAEGAASGGEPDTAVLK